MEGKPVYTYAGMTKYTYLGGDNPFHLEITREIKKNVRENDGR